MGSSGSKRKDDPIDPTELQIFLDLAQKEFILKSNERKELIARLKENLIFYLIQKDLNSSKDEMKRILEQEDLVIIYDIINRIIEFLKGKCNDIVSNDVCPAELRASLDSIIYAAPYCIELQLFRERISKKYGSEYISKVDNNTDFLVNEVLVEKLKKNIYSEELIKTKLKQICIEKNIDYEFLGIEDSSIVESYSSQAINNSNIYTSAYIRNSNLRKLPTLTQIKESKLSKKSDEDNHFKNAPLKMKQGENLFLPYDENIDKKCYNINNIQNWAESFYNIKSGIILEKYKELVSKSEFGKFFEALNYEYGINNYPLDLNKALEIYKKAANTSTDTLSMYRLYHIYKKDYKKFNIKERCHILEKFYIMKCFTYLTPYEKDKELFNRFDIFEEVYIILIGENDYFYEWYKDFFDFLIINYDLYGLNKDDVLLVQAIIYYYFSGKTEKKTEMMNKQLIELAEKGNPEAMFNLICIYNSQKEENIYLKYYEKLYTMNYYRSFEAYTNTLPKEEETLNILKKSISNGYYNHIPNYLITFMMINNFEDIFTSPKLKTEFLKILNGLIDIIIFDNIEYITDLIFMRNKLIKHYNFENEFKTQFDPIFKEIINYLKIFSEGNEDKNKDKIKQYFIQDRYFKLFYTIIGYMHIYGIKGIIEKNYNEALDKYNYLLKNGGYYIESFYLYYKYIIKKKLRLLKIEKNKNPKINDKEDKELIELEKKVLDLNYQYLTKNNIKELPPSFFYYLSKLFRYNAINTKDLILEYVFLNRASNAKIIYRKNSHCLIFAELYIKQKVKKKIKEKNQEENFKKIKEEKGAINVGGYGEDGTICPICLENKKSIIALPCKHFFCGECMNKLLDEANCPICRTKIKITFDINLKKETLIKTILVNSVNS